VCPYRLGETGQARGKMPRPLISGSCNRSGKHRRGNAEIGVEGGSLVLSEPAEGILMSDREYSFLGLAALAVGVAITVCSPAPLPEAAAAPAPTTDEYGYVSSSARCDDGQALMAYGRTSRALVVICVRTDGQLEYRGMRISDQAGLSMPAVRGADGTIVATNNGVTYAVSPTMLLVSEGDSVLYRDSWIEFRQPRFSGGPSSASPSASAAPTSSAGTSSPTTQATVSTTTVTMTPTTSKSGG